MGEPWHLVPTQPYPTLGGERVVRSASEDCDSETDVVYDIDRLLGTAGLAGLRMPGDTVPAERPEYLAALEGVADPLISHMGIRFFANMGAVQAAIRRLHGDGQPELAGAVDTARHIMLRYLFTPELATVRAQEANKASMPGLLTQIQAVSLGYAELKARAVYPDALLIWLEEQLSRAALLVRSAFPSGRPVWNEGFAAVLLHKRGLQTLADVYDKQRDNVVEGAYGYSQEAIARLSLARNLDVAVGIRKQELSEIISQTMESHDVLETSVLVGRLLRRNPASLQDHWKSCEADWSIEQETLDIVRRITRLIDLAEPDQPQPGLLGWAVGIERNLTGAYETLRDLPEGGRLTDVMYRLDKCMTAARLDVVSMAEPAGQMLAILERALHCVKHARGQRDRALTQIEEACRFVQTMQQLPLFQGVAQASPAGQAAALQQKPRF